jgi:hypothetical protein
MIRKSQKALSLALVLALVFWAGAVPSINASSAQMHRCHALAMNQQPSPHTAVGMHSCCPQPGTAPSSVAMAKIACQQSCCKVGRQPAPRQPFLVSSSRAPSVAQSAPTDRTTSPPVQTRRLISTALPLPAKAVFDLKTDLRI